MGQWVKLDLTQTQTIYNSMGIWQSELEQDNIDATHCYKGLKL